MTQWLFVIKIVLPDLFSSVRIVFCDFPFIHFRHFFHHFTVVCMIYLIYNLSYVKQFLITSDLITIPSLPCIIQYSVVCNESKMVNIDTGKWHWDQLSWNCSVTLLQNVHLIQHSRNNA